MPYNAKGVDSIWVPSVLDKKIMGISPPARIRTLAAASQAGVALRGECEPIRAFAFARWKVCAFCAVGSRAERVDKKKGTSKEVLFFLVTHIGA